jgi:hypothetical protein
MDLQIDLGGMFLPNKLAQAHLLGAIRMGIE